MTNQTPEEIKVHMSFDSDCLTKTEVEQVKNRMRKKISRFEPDPTIEMGDILTGYICIRNLKKYSYNAKIKFHPRQDINKGGQCDGCEGEHKLKLGVLQKEYSYDIADLGEQ